MLAVLEVIQRVPPTCIINIDFTYHRQDHKRQQGQAGDHDAHAQRVDKHNAKDAPQHKGANRGVRSHAHFVFDGHAAVVGVVHVHRKHKG